MIFQLFPNVQANVFAFLAVADFAQLDSACANASDRSRVLELWSKEWLMCHNPEDSFAKSFPWILRKRLRPTTLVLHNGEPSELSFRTCHTNHVDTIFFKEPKFPNLLSTNDFSWIHPSKVTKINVEAHCFYGDTDSPEYLMNHFVGCSDLTWIIGSYSPYSKFFLRFERFATKYTGLTRCFWKTTAASAFLDKDTSTLTPTLNLPILTISNYPGQVLHDP